jgi:hypothetical protein
MSEADLLARVQRLEDLAEIQQLKARYCAGCDDDHNSETLVQLFVENAVWDFFGTARCEGVAAIGQYFDDLRASGRIRNSAHMVTNPNIVIDGDTATGHWRFVMIYTGNVGDGTTQFHRIIGYYLDDFVKRDGKWYFQNLVPMMEESDSYPVIENLIATKM